MKRLTDLFAMGETVYVGLSGPADAEAFQRMAEQEGFRVGHGENAKKPTEANMASVMVVHSDYSITYPGFAGIVRYGAKSSADSLVRVNFREFMLE